MEPSKSAMVPMRSLRKGKGLRFVVVKENYSFEWREIPYYIEWFKRSLENIRISSLELHSKENCWPTSRVLLRQLEHSFILCSYRRMLRLENNLLRKVDMDWSDNGEFKWSLYGLIALGLEKTVTQEAYREMIWSITRADSKDQKNKP